jgi:ribbon-helix-helix CopG family protein
MAEQYHRLSVNINDEAAEILRTVTKERQISTTEAIRRAIGLLGFFEEARRRNATVYTEDQTGHRQSVHVV